MRLFSTGLVLVGTVEEVEDRREPPREEEAPELTAPSAEERRRPWLFRLPRPLPDPSPVPLPRPPERPRPDVALGVVRGPEERRTRPLGPFGLGVRER
ncbi:hypothetical protein GTY66_01950 [Streptomyces sp. SID8356]|uniref:hypothetical protein n=1 Tax=unclassified Streptomyces TaxID=2593676 RepID=UPI0003745ADC|nr:MULTISPECIES: hypothetical protein [unclassified Streptomyces]MYT34836.1 hypothetical protein [Streptomyces sp. SID8356]